MNVTPAERRGYRTKTTSHTPLSRGSSSCLCSLLLPYISLFPPLSRLAPRIPAAVHLTHDTSPLRSVTGRVQSLVVSLSILHKRTTSTAIYHFTWHQSGDTSVLVCWNEEKVGLNQDSLRAAGIVPNRHRAASASFSSTKGLSNFISGHIFADLSHANCNEIHQRCRKLERLETVRLFSWNTEILSDTIRLAIHDATC